MSISRAFILFLWMIIYLFLLSSYWGKKSQSTAILLLRVLENNQIKLFCFVTLRFLFDMLCFFHVNNLWCISYTYYVSLVFCWGDNNVSHNVLYIWILFFFFLGVPKSKSIYLQEIFGCICFIAFETENLRWRLGIQDTWYNHFKGNFQ